MNTYLLVLLATWTCYQLSTICHPFIIAILSACVVGMVICTTEEDEYRHTWSIDRRIRV